MFNITNQQIDDYLACTSKGSHCSSKAQTYRSPNQGQQLALAMRERMVLIHAEVRPSLHSRGVIAVYGESLDTLPTILTSLDFSAAERGVLLQEVRAFAGLTRSTRTRAFLLRQGRWKPTKVGAALLPLTGTLYGLAHRVSASLHLDPYVQLAIDAYRNCGLHELVQHRVEMAAQPEVWKDGHVDSVTANLCNTFILQLGERANDNQAGRLEIMHKSMHDKQSRELRKYLSHVPKHYPGARIVRVELSRKGMPWVPEREDCESMINASTQVLHELKLRYGDAIVADVHKLDLGPAGRCIVHLLLAVNGPADSELEGLIQTLLELWDRLFPSQGAVVNCDDFDQFAYRGSGSQIRQHESLAGRLDKAATYLAETDRLIRYGFGAGNNNLMIGTVSGRP